MLTDELDKKLLAELRANSRTAIAELARKLSVSRSTVKDRLSRLEHRGVIKGYSLVLSDDFTKGHIAAHVMIKLGTHSSPVVVQQLKRLRQVNKAWAVSGDYDLILLVEADSPGELDEVLDRIRAMDGIADTLTSVVLSTKFEK